MNLTQSVTPLHLVLAAAVLITAVLALYAPRRLTSVVLFLVFGVFLSTYWATIGAPDVALAEAVIGTGVTGALFGYVVTKMPGSSTARPHWSRSALGVLGGLGLGAGFAWLLTAAASSATDSGDGAAGETGLGTPVAEAMPDTGVEHPITGVLLNLRSYDTLMEMVVLLAAVAIALAFMPAPRTSTPSTTYAPSTTSPRSAATTGAQEAPAAPAQAQIRSPLVQLFVRLVAPVALMLAAWLLFAGSTQPGGAFQAGAALAAVLILLHSSRMRPLTVGPVFVAVLVTGVVAFLAVALGGLLLGDAWLMLRGPWAGLTTIVLETLLAVSIGASLAVVFLAGTGPSAPEQPPASAPSASDHPGGEA